MATAIASSGVRSALARPRTPSVPKSRPIAYLPGCTLCATQKSAGRSPPRVAPGRQACLALRVLRGFTGLLQTVLLALGGARVTSQEAGLLERRAVIGVVLD